MQLRKYSLEQLQEAIKTSISIRQVLSKLQVKAAGGNYYGFHKAVKEYNLDISHFTGQDISGRKLPQRSKHVSEYLINGSEIQSNKLRKYLIRDKIFEPVCAFCKNTTWLNKPIPLELDHIDGVHNNNELTNLRLLCPNCHAFTSTYRGRNISKA